MVGISWAIILVNIVNIIYSYVVKTPTYLETREAVLLYQEEKEAAELAKEKEKLIIRGKSAKANLEQLKQLYEKNLITQADYNAKKKEILNTMFEGE